MPLKKLRIKEESGVLYVFDPIRRKYVVLTPEEEVRQNFINYLLDFRGYSKNLISVEKGTNYHSLSKRTDIVVFDKNGKPFMLVECKAASVPLNQSVIEQASRYNLSIQAPYLCVTNGVNTFCFQINFEAGTSTQLKSIPLAEV